MEGCYGPTDGISLTLVYKIKKKIKKNNRIFNFGNLKAYLKCFFSDWAN